MNQETLDLVFSTLRDISVSAATEPLCICDRYHPAIILSIPVEAGSTSPIVYEQKMNFRKANYDAINDYLGSILWDEELGSRGIDEAVDFYICI